LNPAPEEKNPNNAEDVFDKALNTYKWWNNLSTLNVKDPIIITCFKIGFRILGVLFLLAISPLVILGLIVGITAAF